MKRINLYFISCLFSSCVFGQKYQAIYSKPISFYQQNQNIKCIRIDSIHEHVDSVFFPFYEIKQVSDDCFSPHIASWIGKKVIAKENGVTLFFNRLHDTIKINTHAFLNETWTAFLDDSILIEATIINHDTMNFLGLLDSVKTIGFQAHDKSMNPLIHEINDMHLKISKHYGFITMFNFYLFPGFEEDYFSGKFLEYNMVGLSSPEVGIQNLTWFDVHDFQEGDEIHVKYSSNTFGFSCNNEEVVIKTIKKYLQKTEHNDEDKIVYSIYQIQHTYKNTGDTITNQYTYDTITEVITRNPMFNKLPGEIVLNQGMAYSNHMSNGNYSSKYTPCNEIFKSSDTCWMFLIQDGCIAQNKYIKGLGGPYYSCSGGVDCYSSASKQLVYYKKGETTHGNPLIINNIEKKTHVNQIHVYPNPANEYLNIKMVPLTFDSFTIEIIDLKGQSVMKDVFKSPRHQVNIRQLKTGMYLYKISNKSNTLKTGSVMIE